MPRNPDPSWHMKCAIWDLAAKLGKGKYVAIQRSLDQLYDRGELPEDVPHWRTIKGVIAELQSLPIPVLRTLEEHIWLLREDYEAIAVLLPVQSLLSEAVPALSLDKHRDDLMPVLLDLKGIVQYAVHDGNLAQWYSQPDVPCWPIAQGQVCREPDGTVTVHLDAERKREWQYLKQHFPKDEVWAAIESWKLAVAEDFAGRLALLNMVVQLIEKPVAEGGTGLPVLANMGYMGSVEPAVSLGYAFAIHGQVMSRSLVLRHAPHSREAFRSEFPNTVHLAGQPVIFSPDPTQREAAVEFLLRAQKEWISLPEAEAAAEAYRLAEHRTEEVKEQHLDRLRLEVAFPKGSQCEGCRGWAT